MRADRFVSPLSTGPVSASAAEARTVFSIVAVISGPKTSVQGREIPAVRDSVKSACITTAR